MPLTGVYSVLGRSVVIHNPDGSRLACADLLPANPYYVKALFDDDLGGSVTMLQDGDRPDSDVAVLVNLVYTDADAADTFQHGFHVHEERVDPLDQFTSTGTTLCAGTGGHFDPAKTNTLCSPEGDWAACEQGDLSGKHVRVPASRRRRGVDGDSRVTAAACVGGERKCLDAPPSRVPFLPPSPLLLLATYPARPLAGWL